MKWLPFGWIRNEFAHINKQLDKIQQQLKDIMATEQEATEALNQLTAEQKATKEQLVKVEGETRKLVENVGTLTESVDNLTKEVERLTAEQGEATPELTAAVEAAKTASAETKAQAAVVDELVADEASPEEQPA